MMHDVYVKKYGRFFFEGFIEVNCKHCRWTLFENCEDIAIGSLLKREPIAISSQFSSNVPLQCLQFTSINPSKKIVHFLHKHHASFCIHSFKSHTLFFSIKGQSVSKVVWLSSSKVNSHLQHSCKQKERTYQFEKEIHEHSWRGNSTPGRVKETEYPRGFTGGFAESTSIPARARTPTSTAASTTGSKNAIWPNPNDIRRAASHPTSGEPC